LGDGVLREHGRAPYQYKPDLVGTPITSFAAIARARITSLDADPERAIS